MSKQAMDPSQELFTFTFCKADWDLIQNTLSEKSRVLKLIAQQQIEAGEMNYAEVLLDQAYLHEALASDIEFKLP